MKKVKIQKCRIFGATYKLQVQTSNQRPRYPTYRWGNNDLAICYGIFSTGNFKSLMTSLKYKFFRKDRIFGNDDAIPDFVRKKT